MFYRPFVRYLPAEESENDFGDEMHIAATTACLSAAQHIIHFTREMQDGSFSGGHWFALYATFFAVFSLIYMLLESPSDGRAPIAFEYAKQGRDFLAQLRDCSPVAERCTVSLEAG